MTQTSESRGAPPFNDYLVPAILLLLAGFCLYSSVVVINGYLGINGSWAMSSLAFVACAILSRINTHLRLLLWLHGAQNAVDAFKQHQTDLQRQADTKHRLTPADILAAQEQRTQQQKRMEEQRQREEVLKNAKAARTSTANTPR